MNRYILIGIIILLQACASPIYYAKRIQGQVVDEQTGEPIEGAIIVAQWILFHQGLGHSGHDSRIRVVETVTDKNGYYTIHGSPMIRAIPFTELDFYDPKISVFKEGYRLTSFANDFAGDRSGMIRSSDIDGVTIRLERPSPSIQKRLTNMRIFFHEIYGVATQNWRNFPRMLMAMYEELQNMDLKGINSALIPGIPDISKFSATDKEFLEEFKNGK